MQPVLERRRDAEVSAAASKPPEQLGLDVRIRAYDLRVRGDQVDGQEVVDGQAEPPHQVTEPAAERKAGDACVADDATGRGEPKPLSGSIEFAPQETARGAHGACAWVDPDCFHE